ncbi:MAG: hypothetical protein K8I00_11375, partial [Candidatus Omnitrophica bacterium]|nr:hypothetical protein [Candidatus Omnitrophota bacterium]
MTFFPYRLVEKAYYDKVDATGLGIFRIVYGGLLLGQALLLGFYRHLIFGDEVLVPKLLSYAWILICLFLIAGFQTRLIAIFNYLLSVYIVLALKTYTYDFDKIMIAMNFLLIFIPVSRVLSVDAVMCQRREPGQASSRLTSRLSYIVPVFVCLGLPYFDSVYHKFQSYNWMSGLGIWMPLSLTQMTWLPWLNYSLFLDNEFLAKQMTYLVLIFEFLFIFTFYFRK